MTAGQVALECLDGALGVARGNALHEARVFIVAQQVRAVDVDHADTEAGKPREQCVAHSREQRVPRQGDDGAMERWSAMSVAR